VPMQDDTQLRLFIFHHAHSSGREQQPADQHPPSEAMPRPAASYLNR